MIFDPLPEPLANWVCAGIFFLVAAVGLVIMLWVVCAGGGDHDEHLGLQEWSEHDRHDVG